MFLIGFVHKGAQYLFYRNGFVGGEYEDAAKAIRQHTGKSVAVGGFDKVHVKDKAALEELVGGTPFRIINFNGGLGIPFEAVPCVKES